LLNRYWGGTVVVRFSVLGDVEVWVDGQQVDVGHARQRCVLLALLVDAGRAVSTEVLAERVWADRLPARAGRLLASYLSRLRRVLAGANGVVIERRLAGYVLTAGAESVDLNVFRRLVGEARAVEDDEEAAALYARAVGLWRGEAFDGLDTPWLNAMRVTLDQERRAAELDWNDVELRLGRHHEVLTRVSALAAADPLDERCAGQLMTALYRCGRQAEALECYQQVRAQLAEQLGIDPGPALQQLYQRILNADPALHTAPEVFRTPRQLPRDSATMVGRERELAFLADLLEVESAPVIVVHGAPGVGKSALAVRAAHAALARFPDGQLHVNLCGATPGIAPLSPAEALNRLLRGLGVAVAEIPSGAEEAGALFRTVVAGRRLLVVLDNAASTAQVRPLLSGCAVLVTSRARLVALEGATHLHVGPLRPDAAHAMLDELISDVRPAGEPEATRQLAELCGHLPLALQVAAARLNARPSWAVRDLVDRLADERSRLTELAAGDIALRGSLAVSHAALHDSDSATDRRAARALCLLGLLPVTDVDVHLAAAVLGTSPAEADRIVERLLDAHLVEETMPGQFHMHDLTRLFANELGAATIPPREQRAAFTGLLSHYLATTGLANTLVYPHRAHHPTPEVDVPPKPLAGHQEALQWLDDQCHNMIAVIQQAWLGPIEHDRLGVGLALALHWHLYSGASGLPDTIGFLQDVVTAAERLGDRRSLAYAHGNLAGNLRHIGQLDEANTHSTAELELCREIGDRFGEQRALGNLGYAHLADHRPEQAIGFLQQQLELARDIDAPLGQAFALVNLGKAHHQLGRSAEAIPLIETGLAWYEKTGDHYRQCDVLEVLARIHIDLGQFDEAIELMTRGLDHARHIGYRFGEIWALTTLARAHRLSGDISKAVDYAEQAVTASANLDGTQARNDALTEYARLPH
jgi:DNA-binding SARP family transcriptional activator